jgi:hypothetical protein
VVDCTVVEAALCSWTLLMRTSCWLLLFLAAVPPGLPLPLLLLLLLPDTSVVNSVMLVLLAITVTVVV